MKKRKINIVLKNVILISMIIVCIPLIFTLIRSLEFIMIVFVDMYNKHGVFNEDPLYTIAFLYIIFLVWKGLLEILILIVSKFKYNSLIKQHKVSKK